MGKRITIHRPERLKFEKRPAEEKQAEPETRVARFNAGDVTWEQAGPIEATHVATAEGVVDLRETSTPLRGVSQHQHGSNNMLANRNRAVRVEPQRGGVYSDHLTREGDAAQFTPAENAALANIILTDDTSPEQYRYIYALGNPQWRVHLQTGEQDRAEVTRNIRFRRHEIRWMHHGNLLPVHEEHIAFEACEDHDLSVGQAHRAMHPHAQGTDTPARAVDETLQSPHEREAAQPKRVHPWVHWDQGLLRYKFKIQLKRWRHYQKWHKNKKRAGYAQAFTERGPLNQRDWFTPIAITYGTLYLWFVVKPLMELLDLLQIWYQ